MSNKNYVKGRAFEYKTKKEYEKKGYLVFRTAGSHSVADLIAVPPISWTHEWNPILIQCKTTKDKNIKNLTKVRTKYKKDVSELQKVAHEYGCRAIFYVQNLKIIVEK